MLLRVCDVLECDISEIMECNGEMIMLKVGTVFSGIGAVEHALVKIGIDFKIEFACDNGDVDILSKDVRDDITSIKEKLNEIEKLSNNEYANVVIDSEDKLENIVLEIRRLDIDYGMIMKTYNMYLKRSDYKWEIRVRHINYWLMKLIILIVLENKTILQMKFSVKLESDIKKSDLSSSLIKDMINGISRNNYEYKKILKKLKLLGKKLSMLHEKINTEIIRKKSFLWKQVQNKRVMLINCIVNMKHKIKWKILFG